jgi:predicted porin
MKKILLVLVATSLLTSTALASNHIFYGKANLSINRTDQNNTNDVDLNSNASRIGIKGSNPISDNLKAVYQIEYEIFLDDGTDSNNDEFKQRNSFVGLQGDFGKVIVGNHDTLAKLAQGKIDQFNDLSNGDIKNLIQGENRASNIIIYTSPVFNGFTTKFAFVPDEDSTKSDDMISASIRYQLGSLTVNAAHEDGRAIDSTVDSLTRVTAEYKFDNLVLGVLYQQADEINNDQDAFIFSGNYKLKNGLIAKFQYGESDDKEETTKQIAVGADFKLNKQVKLFTYYSDISDYRSIDIGGLASYKDNQTIAAGFEFKF